jgi:hypothetical protein
MRLPVSGMTLEAAPEPAHQMRGETDQAVIDRRGMLLPRAAGAAQTRGAQPPGHRDLLDRVAVKAAGTHWNRSLSHDDRVDAAWSAAAEALTKDAAAPEEDLLRAARNGITALADSTRRFYGLSRPSGWTQVTPQFGAYWWQPPLSGWENAVVDRIALGQVWAAISPADRRILRALADSDGDYRAAATSIGMGYGAYRAKLARSRAAFRRLWHDGEEPSRHQGRNRARTVTHCPADHEYTPENTLWWREGRRRRRRCRKCETARVAGRQAAA